MATKKKSIELATVIRDVVLESRKTLKDDSLRVGTADYSSDVVWLPSLSPLLDWVLGSGLPLGRVIEISGDPSHGKSTLALDMMVAVQRAGGIAGILDAERTWDRARAKAAGIVEEQLIYGEADTVERGFSTSLHYLKQFYQHPDLKDLPKILVWDTLAHSQTEAEFSAEGDSEKIFKDGMMAKPRKIRSGLRLLTPHLFNAKTLMVFVNQTIVHPTIYGAKKETPGPGLHFAASARLKVYKSGKFETTGGQQIGIRSTVEATKNKMAPPGRSVEIPIHFLHGVDHIYELFDFAVKEMKGGPVTATPGGWYTIRWDQGEQKMRSSDVGGFFTDHPEVLNSLRKSVSDYLTSLSR